MHLTEMLQAGPPIRAPEQAEDIFQRRSGASSSRSTARQPHSPPSYRATSQPTGPRIPHNNTFHAIIYSGCAGVTIPRPAAGNASSAERRIDAQTASEIRHGEKHRPGSLSPQEMRPTSPVRTPPVRTRPISVRETSAEPPQPAGDASDMSRAHAARKDTAGSGRYSSSRIHAARAATAAAGYQLTAK